jgi:hypothetical protein
MDLQEALYKQKETLEKEGYSVAYICIYGSQNYGLDVYTEEYQSDIDMKAIVVPTLDELIEDSKPASKVIETKWGQCDIKDIRSYFQTLLKANPAYVETLYTKYYIVDEKFVNEFNQIFELRNYLIKALSAQMIRAMYGMMCEKEKALSHPYPTIKHKIDKFGYDGKQAHHILRLYIMMKDYYIEDLDMDECLKPDQQLDYMKQLKLNDVPLEEAKSFVSKIMQEAKELKDNILKNIDEKQIDYSIKNDFLKLSQNIIKNKIVNDYEIK